MKKFINLLSLFIPLVFSVCFISCENFLNGNTIKDKLEEVIEYEAAPSFTIRISPEKPEMGNVVTGNEKTVKVNDEIIISFELSSNYVFNQWVALDKSSFEPLAEGIVNIKNPDRMETAVEILARNENILLRPVCFPVLSVKTKTPTFSDGIVSRDRSIVVTFSQKLAENCFYYTAEEISAFDYPEKSITFLKDDVGHCYGYRLYDDDNLIYFKNIKIESEGINFLRYFAAPQIFEDYIVLTPDKNNYIPVSESQTRTMQVEISKDIQNTYGIYLSQNESWQYKIDSRTDKKINITMNSTGCSSYDSVNLVGSGSYSVGEAFDIFASLSDYSNYEFSYWIFNSSQISVVDPKSANTRAILLGGTEDVQLTAVCRLKDSCDYNAPVFLSENISSKHGLINKKLENEWTKDADVNQNFLEDNNLLLNLSLTDNNESGIDKIVLTEQKIFDRSGNAVDEAQKIYTTTFESSSLNYSEYNGQDYVYINTSYKLKAKEGEGVYEIIIKAYDNNNNTVELKYHVLSLTDWFTADNFMVSNEPETWRQDEVNSSSSFFNREKPFNEDWFNEQISWLRWTSYIYKTFSFSQDFYYSDLYINDCHWKFSGAIADDPDGPFGKSFGNYEDVIETDCYNLTNYAKLNFDGLKDGAKLKFHVANGGDSQSHNYIYYFPPAAQIKGVTDKQYYVEDGFSYGQYTYNKDTHRVYSAILGNNYLGAAGKKCETMIFSADEAPLISDDYNSYFTYRTGFGEKFEVAGIMNGSFLMRDHYGLFSDYVFRLEKANLRAFNYYGERYRTKAQTFNDSVKRIVYGTDLEMGRYGCSSSPSSLRYGKPVSRLLSPTTSYFYNDISSDSDTTVETSIANDESLTVSEVKYEKYGGNNSGLMKIKIKLDDAHVNGGNHEVENFISILPVACSKLTNDGPEERYPNYFVHRNTAYYNSTSGYYEALLSTGVVETHYYSNSVDDTDLYLIPCRMILTKDAAGNYKKSNTYLGTGYYTKGADGNGESNGLAISAAASLFADEKENIYSAAMENYTTHTRELNGIKYFNGADSFHVFSIKSNKGGKKYSAKAYIVPQNQNIGDAETNYKNGLYADAYVMQDGATGPVHFGIPLYDLQDGVYDYVLAVFDDKGNYDYAVHQETVYISTYGVYDTSKILPVLDFSEAEPKLSNNYPYTRFYKLNDDDKDTEWNWDLVTLQMTNSSGSTYTRVEMGNCIPEMVTRLQTAYPDGVWVKYNSYTINGEKNYSYGPACYGYEGPSAWSYAFIPPASGVPVAKKQKSLITAGGGAIIGGDIPALVYTVASSRNRDLTGESWELRPKYISPSYVELSESQLINAYSFDHKQIPSGWYYKIIARFNDGSVMETDIQQK